MGRAQARDQCDRKGKLCGGGLDQGRGVGSHGDYSLEGLHFEAEQVGVFFGMLDNQEFRDKALYGVTIEPLELALLTGQETLSLERSILGYQVLLL